MAIFYHKYDYINMDNISANPVSEHSKFLILLVYDPTSLLLLPSVSGQKMGAEHQYMNKVPVEAKGVWVSALKIS